MKRLALVAALLLALAGCGKDDLQGTVTSKYVKPGYDWLYMMPITSCSGKPMICRTNYIPIWYHVPTCYQLTVKGEKSGSTCVSDAKWESVKVGDSYVGPDVDPRDQKVKKS